MKNIIFLQTSKPSTKIEKSKFSSKTQIVVKKSNVSSKIENQKFKDQNYRKVWNFLGGICFKIFREAKQLMKIIIILTFNFIDLFSLAHFCEILFAYFLKKIEPFFSFGDEKQNNIPLLAKIINPSREHFFGDKRRHRQLDSTNLRYAKKVAK